MSGEMGNPDQLWVDISPHFDYSLLMISRYDGKPFLRLLECYVLSSIGHLSDQQEHALNLMAPKLAETFQFRGSWFEIVAKEMDFPPDLPIKIKAIWDSGNAKAVELGLSVDPEEFARQFVDTNFV
jgi:hypothetical protein